MCNPDTTRKTSQMNANQILGATCHHVRNEEQMAKRVLPDQLISKYSSNRTSQDGATDNNNLITALCDPSACMLVDVLLLCAPDQTSWGWIRGHSITVGQAECGYMFHWGKEGAAGKKFSTSLFALLLWYLPTLPSTLMRHHPADQGLRKHAKWDL